MPDAMGTAMFFSAFTRAAVGDRCRNGEAGFVPPSSPSRKLSSKVWIGMHENGSTPSYIGTEELMEITAAQQGVWYGQLVDPDSPKYNIGECFEIRGDLDETLFAAALDRAAALCDSLNTEFVTDGDTVRQRVVRRPQDGTSRLRLVDLTGDADPAAAAERYLTADMAAVDRLDAPHHHFALLRLGARLHYWYVRFHHIATDGLGGAVFARTVADLYGRAARGEDLAAAVLPAAPWPTLSPTRRPTAVRSGTRPIAPTGPAGSRTSPPTAPVIRRMPGPDRTRTAAERSSGGAPTPPRRPVPTARTSGCTPVTPCPSPSSTVCGGSPPPTAPPGPPSW